MFNYFGSSLHFKFYMIFLLLVIHKSVLCDVLSNSSNAFNEAVDKTMELASGAGNVSRVGICMQSLEDLMIRGGIPKDAAVLRNNLTDAELLRLGLLASIALISPWNQNPENGKFIISEQGGVLIEAFHPSASESDIMLCVVCSLLAIIVMFHVTHAQTQYVQSGITSQTNNNPILNNTNSSSSTSTTSTTNSSGHR